MILDAQGKPVAQADLPKLRAGMMFEGIVETKIFKDAIELTGKCAHCYTIARQVLRVADPRILENSETRQKAVQVAVQKLQDNHQCLTFWDGKDDVDDFLGRIEKAARS